MSAADNGGAGRRGERPGGSGRKPGGRGKPATGRAGSARAGDGDRGGAGRGAGKPATGRAGAAGAGRKGAGKPATGRARAGASDAGRTGGKPAAGRSGSGRPVTGRRPQPRRPERTPQPARDVHVADGVRLQKVLASAGLGSRRACEVLIEEGRVEVDGQIVTELGVRIDPATAAVHVDGMRLQLDTNKITIAFNKPLGVVATMDDPEGRPCLGDYFRDRSERLFHVGRLDTDSEGLILLTNDGELSNRATHPKYGVHKTYLVEVNGRVPGHLGTELLQGVELDDGPAALDKYRLIDATHQVSMIEVVLHEGRNRIVRRMFEAVGHPVTRLVRTRMGPIKLGDLPPGRHRVLGQVELGTLMSEVGL